MYKSTGLLPFGARYRRLRQAQILLLTLLSGLISLPAAAAEDVTLLLQWDHQFQFAGYYAALWKRYYADEGLDVTIRTPFKGETDIADAVDEVVAGKADFAIGAADLLIAHDQGKPVVTVATIFHESGAEYFVRRDSGFASLGDLPRLRAARRLNDLLDVEFQSMLLAAGIDPETIRPKASYGGEHALANGSLDLIPGYSFVTPYILNELGVDYISVRPRDYGVRFYGDSLFTSEDRIRRNEEAVNKFVRASLRGWQYALENPVEIADLISEKLERRFPVSDPVAFNRAQIDGVTKLALHPLIEPGHINPGQWQEMHKWLSKAGLVTRPLDIDRFVHDPDRRRKESARFLIEMLLALTVIATLLAGASWIWFLRRSISARTMELANARQHLLDSERLAALGQILDNLPSAVFMKDLDGGILVANRRFEEWFGISTTDVIGKTSLAVFAKDVAELGIAEDRNTVATGQVREFEFQAVLSDERSHDLMSTKFPVTRADGRTVGVGTIVTDISEKKAADDRLRQAQKMEAVGQLTGGVAHDFNNLLAVIIGNTELLKDRLENDDSILDAILRAGQRGEELIQRLLAYSRQQPLRPQVIDVRELVLGMSDFLKRTLGETIDIEISAEPDHWNVSADPGQLENALLNLALNARDAMPEGGKLIIQCTNAQLDETDLAKYPEAKAGAYVVLAVRDAGKGMTAEVLAHAFDPFYTTKEVGEGSGLGLSMVYGFAKQSGGHVNIFSEQGKGTTVELYLPRAASASRSKEATQDGVVPQGRRETVLVIEDDSNVRQVIVQMLEVLGYQSIEVPDAASAREIFAEGTEVALVLSDVLLPGGTSGPKFAEELKTVRPGLKFIFISGYPEGDTKLDDIFGSDEVLLRKPFRRQQLAVALSEALNRDLTE